MGENIVSKYISSKKPLTQKIIKGSVATGLVALVTFGITKHYMGVASDMAPGGMFGSEFYNQIDKVNIDPLLMVTAPVLYIAATVRVGFHYLKDIRKEYKKNQGIENTLLLNNNAYEVSD